MVAAGSSRRAVGGLELTAKVFGLKQKSSPERLLFCLPGEAGKPGHLKEDGVTPTEGKTIRLARASLANGGV